MVKAHQEFAKASSLNAQVSRMKARWLKRVMHSGLPPTAKVFAFIVCDALNCVTLDAWPSQETIAARMRCCTKTVQRAANNLEKRGFITVTYSRKRTDLQRYAPVFIPVDSDNGVNESGQNSPAKVDTNVYLSSSPILLESFPRGQPMEAVGRGRASNYKRAERGRWEQELTLVLGPDGTEILNRLASIKDAIVERLCRALCDGELSRRDVEAARLAASYVRDSGMGRDNIKVMGGRGF